MWLPRKIYFFKYSSFCLKKIDLFDIPKTCYSSLRPSTVKDDTDTLPYAGPHPGPLKRKPKREPFLKNTLIGKFDVEMLVYPEVLDLERLKNIDQLSEILNRFWAEKVTPNAKYFENGLPGDFLNQLTNLRLLKQNVPYSHNGLELTATESSKIIETIGRHLIPFNFLSSQIIVQDVLSKASEDIKDKYFEDIVKNNKIGTICLNESNAEFDIRKCETAVTWSESDRNFILNGQKIWVPHADIADFFIVLGKYEDHGSAKVNYFSLVIDKDSEGISINKHLENGYFIVEFNHIVIHENNFIDKHKGFEIANRIQSLGQFYSSSAIAGVLKDVYDHTTHFLMYRSFLEKYSSESEATQVMLSKLASDIYALESMIYFTAYLMDGFEGQDCEVEIAVLKLFASQISSNVLIESINLLGPHATMNSYQYPFLDVFSNVTRLSQLNVSDDLLKIFVSVKCIEHHKENLREFIKKVRNPYLYPNDAFKHQFYILRNKQDNPKLDLDIDLHLHPSLKPCANVLEYSVKRLEFANIQLLEHYGANMYDNHYSLLRLSNIITEIYAMNCVLSRASRSYCTGIENCDSEVKSAEIFCHMSNKRVKNYVDEISDGPYGELDIVSSMVAKKVLDSKGYYAKHPLARNII